MIDVLERCREKIRGRGLRVVFPETADERIVAAAQRLRDERLAEPILVDDPAASARLRRYADLYLQRRPDAKPAVARRLAAKPLFHAGLMVKAGDADAMVAGAANPTARVIEAGLMTIGLARRHSRRRRAFSSSCCRSACCFTRTAPSTRTRRADVLADIALASADSYRRLLDAGAARRAAVVLDERQRRRIARVDKVVRALAIARAREPALAIDGELQADAALVPAVAAKKLKEPGPSRDARTCWCSRISTPATSRTS